MKLVSKNLRQGSVKVEVEFKDDLWYLSQLIGAKDIIQGKTVRKIKTSEEADATKRAVFMSIRVEKVEFSGDSLRVSGKVLEGPEDVPHGSFHTFSVEERTVLEIIKDEWLSYELSRLDEALEGKKSKILVCVFDREDAFFFILKKSGPDLLSHLRGDVEKKRMTVLVKASFYEQIIRQLEEYDSRFGLDHIVLASPSFWKEELFKVLKNDALRKKIVQATCSSVDEGAVDEVLRRDEVRSALREEKSSRELILVEEVLSKIAKKEAVVYGFEASKSACEAGAVSVLLVTDSLIAKLRLADDFLKLNDVMRSVDKQKGKVVIISGDHMGGKKLDGLGGVAAILRYRLGD